MRAIVRKTRATARGLAVLMFSSAISLLVAACAQTRVALPVAQLPCLADPALRGALGGLGGRLDKIHAPRWASDDRPRRCADDESDARCLERVLEEVYREGPLPADWKIEARVFRTKDMDGPASATVRVDGAEQTIQELTDFWVDRKLADLRQQGRSIEILSRRTPREIEVREAGVSYVWSPRVPPLPMAQLLWATDAAPDEAERRITALVHATPLVSASSRPRAGSTNRWRRYGLTVECVDEAAKRVTRPPARKGWYCARVKPWSDTLACRRTLEACEADRSKTILDRRWQAQEDRDHASSAPEEIERPPGPCEAMSGAICRAYRWSLVASENQERYLDCYVSEQACEEAGRSMLDAEPDSDCALWE